VDFQTWTSPESHIPFPLQGDTVSILDNTRSCGIEAANAISVYLRETVRNQMIPPPARRVSQYGSIWSRTGPTIRSTIFQTTMAMDSMMNRLQHVMEQHGKCFFLFVSQDDMPEQQQQHQLGSQQPLLHGYFWLIPIPPSVFPYDNARRNAKLLKYIGHLVFPNIRTIVWQDAKLVNATNRLSFVDIPPRHVCDDLWIAGAWEYHGRVPSGSLA
jgi:Protein of unknown function (DUF616)